MEMFEMHMEQDPTDLIQLIVSPSELDTMRQCELKHQLMYGERWTKPQPPEGHPLTFGTLWHRITEGHYRAIEHEQRKAHIDRGDWRSFDRKAARDSAMGEVNDCLAEVEDEEVADLLRWMYEGHLDMYGVDDDWLIMATEHAAEVDLPAPEGFKTNLRFRMKMRIDTIAKWDGRVWVVDRKSCKNLPSNLELDLDDQFGLYIWGLRQLGLRVFGAIHDAARKTRLKTKVAPLDERFRRTHIAKNNQELDRIALEAWQVAHSRYVGLQNIVDMKRAGIRVDAPRYPNPMQCSWKCDIKEVCIAGRKGTDLRDHLMRKGFVKDRSRH